MGQKGAWHRSRYLLFKFWDPLISLERMKIQTSNFASRLIIRDTKPENEVNVYNKSGGENHHFRDLETTANDVRKAEKT